MSVLLEFIRNAPLWTAAILDVSNGAPQGWVQADGAGGLPDYSAMNRAPLGACVRVAPDVRRRWLADKGIREIFE